MTMFASTANDAREVKRQMKLAQLPSPVRRRIDTAERAAHTVSERLEKLTTAKRDGTKPIETADAAELDALLSEADTLVEGLNVSDPMLTERIEAARYEVHRAVTAERNRRYSAKNDEKMRLNRMQADFARPLSVIGTGIEAFVAAMDTYPMEKLMGPNEIVSGAPGKHVEATAEDAEAMTDAELDAAVSESYRQAHAAVGVASYAGEVAKMAELLPEVAKAMARYRDSAVAAKQHAADVHAILAAEQRRRRDDAKRAAEASRRPMDDRIAELERELELIRMGA